MSAMASMALQGAGGMAGALPIIINIAAFVAILYFLLIRPQRKMQQRHQAMIAALQKGDEVMTEGGILGTVVHLAEDRITLRTGETRVVVARNKIARKAGAADAADAEA